MNKNNLLDKRYLLKKYLSVLKSMYNLSLNRNGVRLTTQTIFRKYLSEDSPFLVGSSTMPEASMETLPTSTRTKVLRNASGAAALYCWTSQLGNDAEDTLLGNCGHSLEGMLEEGLVILLGTESKSCVHVAEAIYRSRIGWLLCSIIWLIFSPRKWSTFISRRICTYSKKPCLEVDLTLIKKKRLEDTQIGSLKYYQQETSLNHSTLIIL